MATERKPIRVVLDTNVFDRLDADGPAGPVKGHGAVKCVGVGQGQVAHPLGRGARSQGGHRRGAAQ